jgi:hypothetical protein
LSMPMSKSVSSWSILTLPNITHTHWIIINLIHIHCFELNFRLLLLFYTYTCELTSKLTLGMKTLCSHLKILVKLIEYCNFMQIYKTRSICGTHVP